VVAETGERFAAYVRSAAFARYFGRLHRKPAWWDVAGRMRFASTLRALRQFGVALTQEGELVLGLVLMRNTVLADRETAAPALILGSFDLSPAGFETLHIVAGRLDAMRSTDESVAAIFEDDEYQIYRRRELPSGVAAPAHVMLFDELMRGSDFIDWKLEEMTVPDPFVVMFANRNAPILASAVVPKEIAMPVLQYLVEENARRTATMEPPPLPPPLPTPGIVNVATDDEAVAAAIARARRELPGVLVRYSAGEFLDAHFTVKVPIKEQQVTEHFWLSDTSFADGQFSGIIDSDPQYVTTLKRGDRWVASVEDVTDWMYLRDEKIYGNYTLLPKMAAEEAAKYRGRLADMGPPLLPQNN